MLKNKHQREWAGTRSDAMNLADHTRALSGNARLSSRRLRTGAVATARAGSGGPAERLDVRRQLASGRPASFRPQHNQERALAATAASYRTPALRRHQADTSKNPVC